MNEGTFDTKRFKKGNIEHYSWLGFRDIRLVEKKYNATYICDNPLKVKGGGVCNWPIAIFYAEEAHPEGSNWFGMYLSEWTSKLMITNAIDVEDRIINGLKVGELIIYSSYRNDMRCLEYNGERGCIDGGNDYIKVVGGFPVVKLQITKDGLVEYNGEE